MPEYENLPQCDVNTTHCGKGREKAARTRIASMRPLLRVDRPWPEFASGPGREILTRDVLPAYLARQRWFPGKARAITGIAIEEAIRLPLGHAVLFVAAVEYADGDRHRFAIPWDSLPERSMPACGATLLTG